MTSDRPSTVERAYQLARSGQLTSLTEIRSRLRLEGYTDIRAHFTSLSLTADLRRTMLAARTQI